MMMPDPQRTQLHPRSRAKSLACPNCGDIALNAFDVEDSDDLGAVIRTDCLCPQQHIWSVKWVAA